MSEPPDPAVLARAGTIFRPHTLVLATAWFPKDPIESWALESGTPAPPGSPAGDQEQDSSTPTWQAEFRVLRDAPGRPFLVLRAAADALDDHVAGAGLLGGESEQYRDFSTQMGAFRARLVQMRSILFQDQSKISDRVLNSFHVQLMSVFGSATRLIFHHEGVRLDREFAAKLVKKALARLGREKAGAVGAVLTAAQIAAEADRAIGAEAVGAFMNSLDKEKGGADDEPEE